MLGPRVRGCVVGALYTAKEPTDGPGPAFGRLHPWPVLPRRIVADVLVVATLELRHPVMFRILVEPRDAPLDCIHIAGEARRVRLERLAGLIRSTAGRPRSVPRLRHRAW